MNYYNEFDPKAAAWLRELIRAGLIPPGDVDERSITDVKPNDLRGYTQCHLFAGIGGWSYALQLAGWPADRPVWTGSCPCQPFSSAGKQLGQADERHLWSVFFNLIRECRPKCVFGEQVAAAIGKGWLDGVRADLEGEGYACGAVVLGAHSVGAPHLRQRLYWVAESQSDQPHRGVRNGDEAGRCGPSDVGPTGGVADAISERGCGWKSGCENAANAGQSGQAWSNSIWLPCRDGKSRRVKPGLQLLVNGVSNLMVPGSDPSEQEAEATSEARVMRLKGYGNAIVPQVAAEFIQAYLDICPE